jgi:serine/threonine protein kinase
VTEDEIRLLLEPYAERLCEQRRWNLGKFLGAGATAATFEVLTSDGLQALKVYLPSFLEGQRGEQIKKRLSIVLDNLKGHDCPYLVSIFDGGPTENTVFLLMQRAPGECLGKILHFVPSRNIREIVRQVSTAAHFLEGKGLCHRDIKSDNVVVSDDFEQAILLDLGVVRWLDEEVSGGTDDQGQLPFIATAQYSSPEYMFRLVPSGPELWRGLTFYQLGGVLHDLIMKKKLFFDIVEKARENRYLIAHAVATKIPEVIHDGSVSLDLVLLAQRALEKDLSRRLGSVSWANFLATDSVSQNEIVLGLRRGQPTHLAKPPSRIPTWTKALEDALDKKLSEYKIHCRHTSSVESLERSHIFFSWTPSNAMLPANAIVTVKFELSEQDSRIIMDSSAVIKQDDIALCSTVPKPVVSASAQPEDEYPQTFTDQAYVSFLDVAAAVVTQFIDARTGDEK